jgi:hypothetical protein
MPRVLAIILLILIFTSNQTERTIATLVGVTVHLYCWSILHPSCPKGPLEDNDPRKVAQCANATLGFLTMLGVGLYMTFNAAQVEVWSWGPFAISLDSSKIP